MKRPRPSQPPPEEPHAGSEEDPRRELDDRDRHPVLPPRRYEPDGDPSTALGRPTSSPTTMDRVVAASSPLATLVFVVLGFTTGWWYIAWVVFLIPVALKAWNRPDED